MLYSSVKSATDADSNNKINKSGIQQKMLGAPLKRVDKFLSVSRCFCMFWEERISTLFF